jgi:hypothetical protein
MINVKPIRRRSLWERHDMLSNILNATEELLPTLEGTERTEAANELTENREAQQKLRARAERVEGVRHG